jgi:hypothetical protein
MERDGEWKPIQEGMIASDNVMDNWIQAACAGLVQFVRKEMEAYRLYTVRRDKRLAVFASFMPWLSRYLFAKTCTREYRMLCTIL